MAIYVTPDGKHAISGYMYDEKGQNLSEQLFQKEIYTPAGQEMWKRMEKSAWLLDGKKTRRSSCTFSPIRSARIASSSGSRRARGLMREKCSFAHCWFGVIKPESPDTAAAILATKDPAKTWHDYEQSGGKMTLTLPATPAADAMRTLNENQKLMDDLGANVTPAIYYMNKEGQLQQVVGLPDAQKLKVMMGEE